MGFKFGREQLRNEQLPNGVASTLVGQGLEVQSGDENRGAARARRAARLRHSVSNAIQTLEQRVMFAAFNPADIVVERLGDGTVTLGATAAAISLDEFNTSALTQSPNNTVALPIAASGSNNPIGEAGNSNSVGYLTRSSDSRYLVVGGYGLTPTTAIATTSPRVAARVDSTGTADTSTSFTSTLSVRGISSPDGNSFYLSGSSAGVVYVPYANGGGAVQLGATGQATTLRTTQIFNNQLYVDGSSSTTALYGPAAVGTGLPTTAGQSITVLPGFNTNTAGNPNGFVFKDANTVYVADALTTTAGFGGIQKWTLSGGTWTRQYTQIITSTTTTDQGLLAVTIDAAGNLYGTTSATTANRLVKIVDTGSGFTFTTLATAPAKEQFKGVSLAPLAVTPAPTIAVQPTSQTGVAGNSVTFSFTSYTTPAPAIQWYQSTDGGATYQPISGATSSSLTLNSLSTSQNGYMYEAILTNAGGSTTTTPVTLTVRVAPVIALAASSVTVDENAGTVSLEVDRSGDTTTAASATYSTGGGTAAAGTNYTTTTGTVSFAAGETKKFITVPILAQYPQGSDKTFNVTLSPVGGSTVTTAVETVTIRDLAQTFNFTASSYNVNENTTGNASVFTIVRSEDVADAGSVAYTTSDGSAVAGVNYTATSGVVTFTAGQIYGTFTVPITNATSQGGNKTFNVTLSSDPAFTGHSYFGSTAASTVSATETIVDAAPLVNNVTSPATATYSIEAPSGYYNGAPAFAPVNGSATNGTGSYSFLTYQIIQFSPTTTPSVYPAAGQQVTALTNLSLSLFNTDSTPGDNFNGHIGNFNIYYIAAPETGTNSIGSTSFKFITTDVGGLSTQGSPTLLGTFSFNDNTGFDTFTPATLPSAVSNAIISSLNTGASIRLAVTPGATTFAADWQGISGSNSPQLALTDTVVTNQTQESVSLTGGTTTIAENAGNTGITVTRSGSNISDTLTVPYTFTDGSAVRGTNYNASAGTLTFGPGVTSLMIPVTAINVNPQGGNKTFTVTLGTATTSDTAHTVAVAGAFSSSAVTITDTNSTTSNSETLTQYTSDVSTIEAGGPFASAAGPQPAFFQVSGTSKSFPAYAALDFNNVDTNGTNDTFVPAHNVTAINSLTLNVFNFAPTTGTSGPLNVYLVPDASSNIDATVPQSVNPHYFDSVNFPGEGLDTTPLPSTDTNTFGTPTLLGTVQWTSTAQTTSLIPLALNSLNATGQQMLITDLNNGTKFRLIITPGNAAVQAKIQGFFYRLSDNYLEAPQLSIGVQEATVSTGLPAWLDPSSQATFNSTTKVLTVTGPSKIISDPISDLPVINASGAGAVLTVAPTAGSFVSEIHISSLTLTNGASTVLANSTAGNHIVLLVGGTNSLSIDGTSKLDLTNNYLDVAKGSLSAITSQIAAGYNNGLWNGTGITSSTAANNSSYLTAVGSILNGTTYGTGTTQLGLFDGYNPASTDVLVKYTYYGDANLDGRVDGSDYTKIDAGFNSKTTSTPLSGWGNGDFNYDGVIDGSDYTLIDNAFNTQGAPLTASSAALLASPTLQPAKAVVVGTKPAVTAVKSSPFSARTQITSAIPSYIPVTTVTPLSNDKLKSLIGQLADSSK